MWLLQLEGKEGKQKERSPPPCCCCRFALRLSVPWKSVSDELGAASGVLMRVGVSVSG